MELVIFTGLTLVAAVAAVLVIVQRHAVYSALFLIITMGALAGIYILLEAYFVWVIQVIVYAGAIMVLFLFVIMLLDIRREQDPWAPPGRGRIVAAVLLSLVLLVELVMTVAQRLVLRPGGGAPPAGEPTSCPDSGQCSLSPRDHAATLSCGKASCSIAFISATLQPGIESSRTGMEAGEKAVHSQSILSTAQRLGRRRNCAAGVVEETKPNAPTIMRHYLRRYV
jgi:NADH:ubiquinone oxidoreductase subunit 6 (subunit J)